MNKYISTIILSSISLLYLVYIMFKYLAVPSFAESTGLYFFSTLIQSNAAIFSIVGVFYIFRLQAIQTAITNIINALYGENPTIRQHSQDFCNKSLEEKKTYVGFLRGADNISNYYRNWLTYELELNEIKNKIKQPLISITVLIIIQLLFLLNTNRIYNLGQIHEIISYLINIVFEIYILVKVVNSIISIINSKNV